MMLNNVDTTIDENNKNNEVLEVYVGESFFRMVE